MKNSRMLDMKGEGEDITGADLLDNVLIDSLHERQQVRYRLLETRSIKEPILTQVKRSLHLSRRRIEMCSDRQVIARPQRWIHLLLIDR